MQEQQTNYGYELGAAHFQFTGAPPGLSTSSTFILLGRTIILLPRNHLRR